MFVQLFFVFFDVCTNIFDVCLITLYKKHRIFAPEKNTKREINIKNKKVMNNQSFIFIASGIALLIGFLFLIAFIVSTCRKRDE